MKELLVGGRCSGKTTELIKWCKENNGIFFTFKKIIAEDIHKKHNIPTYSGDIMQLKGMHCALGIDEVTLHKDSYRIFNFLEDYTGDVMVVLSSNFNKVTKV